MLYKVTHCVLANVNLISGTGVIRRWKILYVSHARKIVMQVAGVIQA